MAKPNMIIIGIASLLTLVLIVVYFTTKKKSSSVKGTSKPPVKVVTPTPTATKNSGGTQTPVTTQNVVTTSPPVTEAPLISRYIKESGKDQDGETISNWENKTLDE